MTPLNSILLGRGSHQAYLGPRLGTQIVRGLLGSLLKQSDSP